MSKSVLYFFIILSILTGSCTGRKDTSGKKVQPDKNWIVKKAGRFVLQKTDSCTILTISNPWQGAEGIKQIYYLVKKGAGHHFTASAESVIFVPVERIICMSTTHLAMITALGMQDAVTGVSGGGFIYDSMLSERIRSGIISDVGFEAGLNNELIIKKDPDLIMMYGIGGESAGYISKIREMGFKVMFNADYLETDPLGKAEWIRVFGALFCVERKADSLFNSVCEPYNQIKEYIEKNTMTKPEVLLGMPYRDTWFISPGNSYISNIIKDAGGIYMWQDTKSSFSLPYSLETVYLKSMKADYWINIGNMNSKCEIASFDQRLATIPAFIRNNLYNNNKRMSPGGGNDYWEGGTMNPHIILKDIATILHPGIFGDYELFYYRKIE
jgi:iron complex transport system substrate-binding protein